MSTRDVAYHSQSYFTSTAFHEVKLYQHRNLTVISGGHRWHSGWRIRPEICMDLSDEVRAPSATPLPGGGTVA
ncbi:hypothetical protein PoB_000342200 [Plakobranchus ocellatus]|uniref:Uncharacterized protein n=1 Tax=Plakobranchus ocellatus TaxID=259542 RepID=A0AAV3Y3A6_9GAST|nr:hypothetical protein PoB_000342200 [Plakobranchus ocellatus]